LLNDVLKQQRRRMSFFRVKPYNSSSLSSRTGLCDDMLDVENSNVRFTSNRRNVYQCRVATYHSSSSRRDLYEILDVKDQAPPDEIKRAFYGKAKKLHPDRSQLSKEEAQSRFVEISEAYQILMDPNERRIYDEDRRRRVYMNRQRIFRNKTRTSSSSSSSYQTQRPNRVNPESETNSFVEELQEALRLAYEGPTMCNQRLLSSPNNIEAKDEDEQSRWFPLEFELEERNFTDHHSEEVLCMCLGRTVLGRVYESTQPPANSWIGDVPDSRWLIFEYQNKIISFAERKVSSLEIHLIESKERVIMTKNRSDNIFQDYVSSHRLGNQHRMVTFRTPYMLHTHFLTSSGRHAHAKMQRVLLAPSSLWIFPPRDERFTRATYVSLYFSLPLSLSLSLSLSHTHTHSLTHSLERTTDGKSSFLDPSMLLLYLPTITCF